MSARSKPKRTAGGHFVPGASGNPGGRTPIAKILDEFKTSPHEVRVKLFKKALKVIEEGPKHGATFRYCHQWVGDRVGLKEAIVIETRQNDDGEIDWSSVPDDELDRMIAEAGGPDDGAVH